TSTLSPLRESSKPVVRIAPGDKAEYDLLGSCPCRVRYFATMVVLIAAIAISAAEPAPPPCIDVFVGGEGGYPAYRIPALITTRKGTMLAFAEGRASLRDHAENDIVLKRSSDNGTTWRPLQVVDGDGSNALNNPTAVVMRETGRVLLM